MCIHLHESRVAHGHTARNGIKCLLYCKRFIRPSNDILFLVWVLVYGSVHVNVFQAFDMLDSTK